jgi:hypothetical protein
LEGIGEAVAEECLERVEGGLKLGCEIRSEDRSASLAMLAMRARKRLLPDLLVSRGKMGSS